MRVTVEKNGPFGLSELANFMDELATRYWETGDAEPQISIVNVADGYKVIITPK